MKKFKLIFVLLGVLIANSCDDLEIPDPNNISADGYFNNQDEIQTAVHGVYAALIRSDYYPGEMLKLELKSDDAVPGDDGLFNADYGFDMDNFTDNAAICAYENLYAVGYVGVARANQLVERIETSPIEESLKNVFSGEVRFLRAFFYFNLVRMFGDVPIALGEITDYSQFDNITRSPLEEVYASIIIPDLEFASENLLTKSEMQLGRATNFAAKSLLAKVYLTIGSMGLNVEGVDNPFQLSRDLSMDVIQNGGYALEDRYYQLFTSDTIFNSDGTFSFDQPIGENGIESIFELQYLSGAGTGYKFEGRCAAPSGRPQRQGEGHTLNVFPMPRFQGTRRGFFQAPMREGWGIYVPSNSNDPRPSVLNQAVPAGTGIVEAYEADDERFEHNIMDYRAVYQRLGEVTNDDLSPYNGWKYRDEQNSTNVEGGDNVFVLRLADVYLMFAEAENEINGPTSDAYFYLNEVRRRAFQDTDHDISGISDRSEFLDVIYNERRLELYFEFNRWFDLARRPQMGVDILQAHGKTNASLNRMIFPIPLTVIDDSDGLITQNPGW